MAIASTAFVAPLQAQETKILNVMTSAEPDVISSAISTTDAAKTISVGKILGPLFRFDQDNKPKGILAKIRTISDDGLTYTFNLRKGVKWHDGWPFTAGDVVYS